MKVTETPEAVIVEPTPTTPRWVPLSSTAEGIRRWIRERPKFAVRAAPGQCELCGDGPNVDETTRLCKPCFRVFSFTVKL